MDEIKGCHSIHDCSCVVVTVVFMFVLVFVLGDQFSAAHSEHSHNMETHVLSFYLLTNSFVCSQLYSNKLLVQINIYARGNKTYTHNNKKKKKGNNDS